MDDDVLAAWHNAMAALGATPMTVGYNVLGSSTYRPVHVVSASFVSDGVEINIVTTVWLPAVPDGSCKAVTQITCRGRAWASHEIWDNCAAAVMDTLRGAFINAAVCLRCAHLLEQHVVVGGAVRCHCGCGSFK
jgi:hypothetical protein